MRKSVGWVMLFWTSCFLGVSSEKELEKYAAIVVEADTGRVLESENPDKICHPASLTKMMTLYFVFEAIRSGRLTAATKIPVSKHASRQIPSKLGLKPGDYVSVETIIKGLVTRSANDAAAAIGEFLGGSEARFASMMTSKARELGMKNTVFRNASGVPDSAQVTSARDMATLSRALLRHFPQDYRHFKLKSFSYKGRQHPNHNHLLGRVRGVDGIKTGFVNASGSNLAASAVRMDINNKSRRLIVVVLGGPNRFWRDRRVTELLERNFRRIGIGDSRVVEVSLRASSPEKDQNDSAEHLVDTVTHTEESVKPTEIIPIKFEEEPKKPRIKAISVISSLNTTVQLGTYSSRRQARQMAISVFQSHKTGTVLTPTFVAGTKRQYAAQIANLTGETAERICADVRKGGKTCVIMESPTIPNGRKHARPRRS